MSPTLVEIIGAVVVALLAGLLGGGAVVVKWMDRDVTKVTAERGEIDNLRTIIDEVARDAEELRARVRLLEERERHMLTRAAVHEAWDQFAFAALIAQNPQHPPPPPLSDPAPITAAPTKGTS